VILATVHRQLSAAERVQAEQVSAGSSAAVASASVPARVVPVPASLGVSPGSPTAGILVAAVDDSPMANIVTEAAARLAAHANRTVHVVHAREAAVGGDVGIDGEDLDAATTLVTTHLDQIAAHRVPAEGQILLHAGDHGAAGRVVAEYANDVGATTIVIGAPTHGGLSVLMDASSSKELMRVAKSNVLILNPAAPQPASASPVPARPQAAHKAAVAS
jgi:MFS transporter, ACDE family, multidrug resistance protein